jgi:transposase
MSSSLKSRKSISSTNNNNINSDLSAYSYVGVDISKDKLDFFISDNSQFITICNSKISIDKFIKSHLSKLDNPLVTCEATGGWERILLLQLASHNIHSHTAHATKIYHFAKSKGTLAKTDKLDAKTIASFAIADQLEPSSVPKSNILRIKRSSDAQGPNQRLCLRSNCKDKENIYLKQFRHLSKKRLFFTGKNS